MVSVIVANYNKARCLPQFFESLQASGLKNFEVIFVDDASTDGSAEYARGQLCHVLVNEKNSGPAFSRNRGAREAKGDILLFCDSDIIIDQGVLAKSEARYANWEVDTLTGHLALPPFKDNWIGNFYLLEEEENCHYGKLNTGPTRYWSTTLGFIRKDLFLSLSGFDESYRGADIEDLELSFRFPKETKMFFEKEMTFHHLYESEWLVFKKAFRRSSQLGRLKIDFKDNSLLNNTHRRWGYIFSALFFVFFLSGLVFARVFGLAFLFVIVKAFYHKGFLQRAYEVKGFRFAFYCLAMSLLMAVPVGGGFLWGRFTKSVTEN